MNMLIWYAAAALAFAIVCHGVSTIITSKSIQNMLFICTIPLFAIAAFLCMGINANVFSGLLALACYILIINATRIVERRMHARYLQVSVRRTAMSVVPLLLLWFIGWYLTTTGRLSISAPLALTVLSVVSGVIAVLFFATCLYRFIAGLHNSEHLSDKELPTVTVAIPARNETHALTVCLQAVLANDYPKLEILVLDDCSLDNTAEIIRGFAQDGVRFIEGKPVPENGHWLSKNFAYEQLSKAAAGEYILFCSVDTQLAPQAVRNLVTHAVTRRRRMLSVLPSMYGTSLSAFIVEPLRAWWQMVIPKELFGYSPAMSSCWLIERKALKAAGNFAGVSRMLPVESHFARLLRIDRAYSFVANGSHFGVRSRKSLKGQYRSARRSRYPEAHRRPENVYAWLIFEAVIGSAYVAAVVGYIQGYAWAFYIGTTAAILYTISYVLTIWLIRKSAAILSLFSFPFSLAAEMILLNSSMVEYEFGSIEWKGRNVCLPVMHVIPRLPELPDET